MLKKTLGLIAVCILSYALLSGANDQFYFKHLSIDQGLSQSSANSVLQDKLGFIWIATQQGLNKYNGHDIKVFVTEPGKNSIASRCVLCLSRDTSSGIWIGTIDGLSFYDQSSNWFKNWHHDEKNPSSLGNNRIYSLFMDRKGRLWIGTENGYSIYDRKSNSFQNHTHFDIDGRARSLPFVNHIIQAPNGDILLASAIGGLFWLDESGKLKKWYHALNDGNSISNNSVQNLLFDTKGNLWIGTVNGLDKLNLKTGVFKIYKRDPKRSNSISYDDITRIYMDHLGNIWVGTEAGLNLYREATDDFEVFMEEETNPQSLGGNHIVSLYEDKQDILWVGTWDAGVSCMYRQQKAFESFSHHPEIAGSLGSNIIFSFLRDSRKTLWVGAFPGGLSKYDPKSGTFKRMQYEANDKQTLSSDFIPSLAEDFEGNIWAGTRADGMNKIDPQTLKCERIYSTHERPKFPSSTPIFEICPDKKRNCFWLGTFTMGLVKMDPKTLAVKRYNLPRQSTSSSSTNPVICIRQDENGILWIGTFEGLFSFDPETEKFQSYTSNPGKSYSLNSTNICGLCLDKDKIWLATDNCLSLFNKKTKRFRNFSVKDGLPDNLINAVLLDNAGNLWASTNKGISYIILPKEGVDVDKDNITNPLRFKNYSVQDGLQGSEFNGNAAYKDDDGNLYFGGMNGFTIIHPDKLEKENYRPEVYLTDFMLFNKEVLPGDSSKMLSRAISFAEEVHLNYHQNVFSIGFAGINYKNPEKNRYQYMLEGFDKTWINAMPDKRFATYTNLDPGTYLFRVRANTDGGDWGPKEASVRIIVNPPFWGTIWFRISSLLGCAFLLVGSVRYVSHRKYRKKLNDLERQQEIANIRSRIARDIHDHIGAELTRISLLSEVTRLENTHINGTSLDKLSEASREISGQLGEIVWSVNPMHDNLDGMFSYMRNYTLQFLESTKLKFEIDLPEKSTAGINPEVRRNLFLILKEALNNAVKHAKASLIIISFMMEGNEYVMKIIDDGMGIKSDSNPDGNGLMNMQTRMENIGGHLRVISYEGKGTSIIAEGKLY